MCQQAMVLVWLATKHILGDRLESCQPQCLSCPRQKRLSPAPPNQICFWSVFSFLDKTTEPRLLDLRVAGGAYQQAPRILVFLKNLKAGTPPGGVLLLPLDPSKKGAPYFQQPSPGIAFAGLGMTTRITVPCFEASRSDRESDFPEPGGACHTGSHWHMGMSHMLTHR